MFGEIILLNLGNTGNLFEGNQASYWAFIRINTIDLVKLIVICFVRLLSVYNLYSIANYLNLFAE